MRIKEFKKLLEDTFEKSRKTYDHKMNEYATDIDVFQSFKSNLNNTISEIILTFIF